MEQHLFIACFVVFALYATVLTSMFTARVRDVLAGTTDPKYFKTYDIETEVPKQTRLLARNHANLLEAPTLFFAVIALILALGLTHPHLVFFAYAYAATRVIHTLVHVTHNRLRPRIAAFFASTIVLTVLWVRTLTLVLA